MLTALEAGDEPVVFLGDIFDLWISLPRYEESMQRRFLAWCRHQRQRREIGFVEGNHEFYVVRRHKHCFTWSSNWGKRRGDVLFVHGDLINREDRNYLRWRKLSKNFIMRTLVRFLPGGPRLVQKTKAKMKKTNQAFRLGLPKPALVAYARTQGQKGIAQVLVGHFHEAFSCEDGARLAVLPDWFADHWISRLEEACGGIESGPWQQLLK